MNEFLPKLKNAFEEGLLIFIKYVLVIALAFLIVNYATRINQAALNGEQAAIYLNLLQQKGYLPPVQNGTVPDLPKKE